MTPRPNGEADRRLWWETGIGLLGMALGFTGVALMIWRESYNPAGLLACFAMAGWGGVYVNKLRGLFVIDKFIDIIRAWRGS